MILESEDLLHNARARFFRWEESGETGLLILGQALFRWLLFAAGFFNGTEG